VIGGLARTLKVVTLLIRIIVVVRIYLIEKLLG
jgi:phage shock protein PspC (stress-responsive transcriptional regulator)